MREENERPGSEQPEGALPEAADGLRTRRAMLRIGALGAVAVVTVRPANAMVVSSALTCKIPVPQSTQPNKWIKKDGTVVNPNTANSYAPPSQPLSGENVKNVIKYGGNLPGYNSNQTEAYINYIKKLTVGKQGYTCYASLQSPNRY